MTDFLPPRRSLLAGLTISVGHTSAFALASALVLTACGGGSGDTTPAPAPTAPAPPAPAPTPPAPAPAGAALLGSCPAFPATAIFNTRIDDSMRFPAHAQSAAWIASIGGTRALHADWGRTENQAAADYYGIPLNLLSDSGPETDWPGLAFTGDGAPDESDCALPDGSGGHTLARNCLAVPAASRRFPFPRDAVLKAEGGSCNNPASCGDRHVLIVEQGACRLWESYFSYQLSGQWTAYSTAAWDLRSNAMRPDSWTSGDAAGLPIAPLLVRAGEASAGEIAHAMRVTFRDSVLARAHVWPARHRAGGDTLGGIPFGALLRLRADAAIPANWTTQARAIALAMQRYGLYVSDIGSDLYVQGEPSVQWDSATISQIQTLRMEQFEFVDLGSVTGDARFSVDSFAAGW